MSSRIEPLLTVADLDAFPDDDGNRYELIGGELFVSRAPGIPHQRVLHNLQSLVTVTPIMTLYVVPDCPLCAHAREWLRQNSVAYEERNVAGDFGSLRAMYELTRQRLVPVFEANGRALVRPTDAELAEFLL